MFCPVCHSEFRAGFDICSDCSIPLVPALPGEPEPQVEWPEPVTVFRSSDPALIAVTTSFLQGAGLPFVVQNEHVLTLFGSGLGTTFSAIVDVEVQVEPQFAEDALQLLADAEEPLPQDLLLLKADDPCDELPFFPVGVGKLLFLSIATFGLYEIVWFYRNWRRIDDWTSNVVLPLGKALFAPAYALRLFQAISAEKDRQAVPGYFDPTGASLLFALLSSLVTLPSPFWLLALATVVPLAWAQSSVNRLHLSINPASAINSRISLRNVAWVGFCWLLLLAIASLSSTALLRGTDLSAGDRSMLISEGYLRPNEEIIYFYSATPWSFREHGSFYTSDSVVTYTREGDERDIQSVPFARISDIEAWLEPSVGQVVVLVLTVDGQEVYLLAGTGESSQIFVDGLIAEWRLAPFRKR